MSGGGVPGQFRSEGTEYMGVSARFIRSRKPLQARPTNDAIDNSSAEDVPNSSSGSSFRYR